MNKLTVVICTLVLGLVVACGDHSEPEPVVVNNCSDETVVTTTVGVSQTNYAFDVNECSPLQEIKVWNTGQNTGSTPTDAVNASYYIPENDEEYVYIDWEPNGSTIVTVSYSCTVGSGASVTGCNSSTVYTLDDGTDFIYYYDVDDQYQAIYREPFDVVWLWLWLYVDGEYSLAVQAHATSN